MYGVMREEQAANYAKVYVRAGFTGERTFDLKLKKNDQEFTE